MTGSASFQSSVINMLKTAIGSGVLALPYAIKVLGYGNFFIILISAACIAYFSVYILLLACESHTPQVYNYEQVSRLAFKNMLGTEYLGARIAGLFIWLQVFGAVCSYTFLLKSTLPELLKFLLSRFSICVDNDAWYLSGVFIVACLLFLVIFPLSCAKKLDFLKYSSSIGFTAYTFTVMIIIAYKFIVGCEKLLGEGFGSPSQSDLTCPGYKPDNKTLDDWKSFEDGIKDLQNQAINNSNHGFCEAKMFNPINADFFKAIASIFFAYNLHDTLLAIYENLQGRSKKRMMQVSGTAFFIIVTIYALTAYFGYFTWYGTTVSDILLMYSKTSSESWAIFFARLFVCVSILFSVPLVTFASRMAFFRAIDTGSDNVSESEHFIDDSEKAQELNQGRKSTVSENSLNLTTTQTITYNFIFLGSIFAIVTLLAGSLGQILFTTGLVSIHLYVVLPAFVWIFTFWPEINSIDKLMKNKSNLIYLSMCIFMIVIGEVFVVSTIKSKF